MKLIGLFALVFTSLVVFKLIGASEGGMIFGSLFGGLSYVLTANDGDKP